jgi:single-strand DNA-binding protein
MSKSRLSPPSWAQNLVIFWGWGGLRSVGLLLRSYLRAFLRFSLSCFLLLQQVSVIVAVAGGKRSMSVNKVILVGRLGRDPETRFTGGGQAVANFSVATDETYKDKNGERQKRTEWHKIVVWGKQAEIAQQYLKKGSLIFIEGRIQSREWQDKEGQKRTSFEIVASNFRMLGGRGDGAAGSGGGASRGGGASSGGGEDLEGHAAPADDFGGGGHPSGGGGGGGPEISDEDIPF